MTRRVPCSHTATSPPSLQVSRSQRALCRLLLRVFTNCLPVTVAGVLGMGVRFTTTDSHLSYLPLAHVFEMLVETALWYGGSRVGFSQVCFSVVLLSFCPFDC